MDAESRYRDIEREAAQATIAALRAEIDRLKRYETEYNKREWDETILYNNLFKANQEIERLKANQRDENKD